MTRGCSCGSGICKVGWSMCDGRGRQQMAMVGERACFEACRDAKE